MRNWEDIAPDLIRHLHVEVVAAPSDATTHQFLAEVLAHPGVPASCRLRDVDVSPAPMLTHRVRE